MLLYRSITFTLVFFYFFSQVWHGDFLWGLNFYGFNVCCRMSQVVESQELKSVTLKNSSKFVHGWSEIVASKV